MSDKQARFDIHVVGDRVVAAGRDGPELARADGGAERDEPGAEGKCLD